MIKKGLIAGVVLLVVAFGFTWLNNLFPTLSAEYQNPAIFRPWEDPLMMAYFFYPFILGFVAYYLWGKVGKPKPFEFAKLYFWVATLPGMFVTYTTFQISLLMVVSWAVIGFIQAYIAALIFTKVK